MSWLLVRSPPRVLAGWEDFTAARPHANENPVSGLWKPSNSPTNAYAAGNELVFAGAVDLAGIPGSWSYEHQPFTTTWGLEFDYKGTLNAPSAQNGLFYALVGGSWTTRNLGSFFFPPTSLAFRLFHQNPISGEQDRVQLLQINENSFGSILAFADLPGGAAWWGSWHSVRVWIDQDTHIRVWIDGNLMIAFTLPTNVRPSPGKRAFNFINQHLNQLGYLRNFRTYDRAFDMNWTPLFFDNFDRANGAVGNGWTQLGNNAGIVSNSWSTTGTTDGGRAILRDTGITNGACRVEGIIGGNIGVGSSQHSDILLCANGTTGNQALAVRCNNGTVSIGRYSGAFTGASPSFTEFRSFGYSPSNGDIIGAALKDGTIIVDLNGAYVGFAGGVHDVVPASNSWYGLRVKRQAFGNSFSWNACQILDAA